MVSLSSDHNLEIAWDILRFFWNKDASILHPCPILPPDWPLSKWRSFPPSRTCLAVDLTQMCSTCSWLLVYLQEKSYLNSPVTTNQVQYLQLSNTANKGGEDATHWDHPWPILIAISRGISMPCMFKQCLNDRCRRIYPRIVPWCNSF